MSDTNAPAPGWYPAPHANNEQRYWDGQQWLEVEPGAAETSGSTADTATKQSTGARLQDWLATSRGRTMAIAGAAVVGLMLGVGVTGAILGTQLSAVHASAAELSNDLASADRRNEIISSDRDSYYDALADLQQEMLDRETELKDRENAVKAREDAVKQTEDTIAANSFGGGIQIVAHQSSITHTFAWTYTGVPSSFSSP